MNEPTNAYIAFEGVIGVGKTTLVRQLQPRFQAQTLLEAFDENPFLSNFYGDRARYAFQTQLFFLLSRYRQQQTVPGLLRQCSLLADYFFDKDRLFAHLNIQNADELAMYDRLYEALAEKVRAPDLIVYLRAETDMLMARIAMRDRPYERQMDRDYIAALRGAYERLFAEHPELPLLVLETDAIDFVRFPEHLDDVERRVRAALAGVRQPAFPEISEMASPRPAWQLAPDPTANPSTQANWQALGDYLALAESVGRVGGALAQHPPVGPDGAPLDIQQALRAAARALATLARRTGTSLES